MKKKALLFDFIYTVIGGIIWAVSIDTFTAPNLIAPGGVSGIATVLNYFFHLPIGTMIVIFNIPLFLISFKKLGIIFVLKTGFSVLVTSAIIDGFALFLPTFTEDKLLAAAFGGILGGLGLGIIYSRDITTGGTDLLARLVHDKLPFIAYGKLILIFDAAVVVVAAIAFKDWISALYAAITIYLTEIIVDKILDGLNTAKLIYVISPKKDEIAAAVMSQLERGATSLKGTGCYTGMDKEVLMIVVKRFELPKVKNIIKESDKYAFVIVGEVSEVLGEGFTKDYVAEQPMPEAAADKINGKEETRND